MSPDLLIVLSLMGRPLGELDLPAQTGVKTLLIERGRGRARRLLPRTPETVLEPGDILIDFDRPEVDAEALAREYGVELLPRTGTYFADRAQQMGLVYDELLPAARKAPYAVFTLGVVVTLMATGVVPNVQAALIGCLLMGLVRCINPEQAYRSIQWMGLIMIVGMLPFALALDRTGGVDLAAHAVVTTVGGAGSYAILALLYLVTVVLGLFIVNTANAVLLVPWLLPLW